MFGQQGEFDIEVRGIAVRISWEGVYGICFPSFAAHVVHKDKPFISSTGYRSFLGSHNGDCQSGFPPDQFALCTIEEYIDHPRKDGYGLGGGSVWIDKEHGGPGKEVPNVKSK